MIVLGTPVANRAWALPTWFDYLASQTVRPDGCVFIHGGEPLDETWQACLAGSRLLDATCILIHDDARPHDRADNERFTTLARLRDMAMDLALTLGRASELRYLSLDTDVMLGDPTTIARLDAEITTGADVAAPVTWLQPTEVGPETNGWAVNAFRWTSGEDGPGRWFARASREDAPPPWPGADPRSARVDVDFTAAAQIFGADVIHACRYQRYPHTSGEDCAFGRSLALDLGRAPRVVWLPGLRARHVWSEASLNG